MKLENNTVLITGGSAGIGFALAKRFAAAGSEVIICGRREEQLREAKKLCPNLHTIRCDVSVETERLKLFKDVVKDFPKLNVLINNAGVQNRQASLREPQDWKKHEQEIAINLEAPMHLTMLFSAHLVKQKFSAIINVSSGLAFVPLSFMPTYCATKAALHSFTMSLRHQFSETPMQVIEIVPPAVDTDLGGKGLHTQGVNLDEFADGVIKNLIAGELEFGHGHSDRMRMASREDQNKIFVAMNSK